ncbi:hypothetical protein [Phascolarctobacterium succinatutens]
MPNNIVILSMSREWQRELKYKCTNMGTLSGLSGSSQTELAIKCFDELLQTQEPNQVSFYIMVHNAQEAEAFSRLQSRFNGKLRLQSVELQEGKNAESDYQNAIKLFGIIHQHKAVHKENMLSMDISSADYRLFMDVSALLFGMEMKKGLYIKVDHKKRVLSIPGGSNTIAHLHYTVQLMQSCLKLDVIDACSYDMVQDNPYAVAVDDVAYRLNSEIKHCCSYDKIKNTQLELADRLECYKSDGFSLTSLETAVEETCIAHLRQEYSALLNTCRSIENIPALIKWCLKKDMPMQAAFFAIELLPDYMFASGCLKVERERITAYCRVRNKSWRNWRIYFLKAFSEYDFYMSAVKAGRTTKLSEANFQLMRKAERKTRIDRQSRFDVKREAVNSMTQEELHYFAQAGRHLSYISCRVPQEQTELKTFLEAAKRFIRENNSFSFAEQVMALPATSSLRKVLLYGNTINSSWYYLQNSISEADYCDSADSLVVKSLDKLPASLKQEWFGLEHEVKLEVDVKKNEAKQQKNTAPIVLPEAVGERSKLLRQLLESGDVSTKMNVKKLFAFVDCYQKLLLDYRNSMAHCELESADGWQVEGLLYKMLRCIEE